MPVLSVMMTVSVTSVVESSIGRITITRVATPAAKVTVVLLMEPPDATSAVKSLPSLAVPNQPNPTTRDCERSPVRVIVNVIGSGPVSEPIGSVAVIKTTGRAGGTSSSAIEPLALDGEPTA